MSDAAQKEWWSSWRPWWMAGMLLALATGGCLIGYRLPRHVQLEVRPMRQTRITVDLPGGAEMAMVWIQPGSFVMGSASSESDRDEDEGPQHEVTIGKGFYLGTFEITQRQWECVTGIRPWTGKSYVQDGPDHPAVYVSWYDAQAFMAKLNQVEGAEVYRLPTEAEWEYACRAGTTTPWSFADDEGPLGNYAWYDANAWDVGEEYAHTVGQKKPNPWGLYDMHGNVWEWCQDWYDKEYYSKSPGSNPTGPQTGRERVLRGGSWHYGSAYLRCAYRGGSVPSFTYGDFGFRVLRSLVTDGTDEHKLH